MTKDKPSAGIPVPVVMVGTTAKFVRAIQAFAPALPKVFRTLTRLKLQASFRGLDKIRFVESTERGSDAYYYNKSEDIISIYPFAAGPFSRLDKVIYMALAERYWYKEMSAGQRVQWQKKLVYPKKSVIDRLQASFSRGGKTSFTQFVDEFKEANERLVVIHLCNALIKNSVRATNSRSINLTSHPATSSFARARTPYSLLPLISAYGGRGPSAESYETVFANYCAAAGKLEYSEASVGDAVVALFQSVSFDS